MELSVRINRFLLEVSDTAVYNLLAYTLDFRLTYFFHASQSQVGTGWF